MKIFQLRFRTLEQKTRQEVSKMAYNRFPIRVLSNTCRYFDWVPPGERPSFYCLMADVLTVSPYYINQAFV